VKLISLSQTSEDKDIPLRHKTSIEETYIYVPIHNIKVNNSKYESPFSNKKKINAN